MPRPGGSCGSLLRKLSGKTHHLISAAALARDGAVFWHHTGAARLTMRAFSEAFLDAYLAAEGEARAFQRGRLSL